MSDEAQTPHRRSEDLGRTFEGRVSSLESSIQSQGQVLKDFMNETRKNTDDIFKGLNKLSEAVSRSKTTDWQQLGVMLTLAGMVGGFLFVAFIAPLQTYQKGSQEKIESIQVETLKSEKDMIERIHQIELDLVKHSAREKARVREAVRIPQQ